MGNIYLVERTCYALVFIWLELALGEVAIREQLGQTHSRRFTLSSLFLLGFFLFLFLLTRFT